MDKIQWTSWKYPWKRRPRQMWTSKTLTSNPNIQTPVLQKYQCGMDINAVRLPLALSVEEIVRARGKNWCEEPVRSYRLLLLLADPGNPCGRKFRTLLADYICETWHVRKVLVFLSIIVQQDATMYSLLYFCKLLYMFRVVTPPIIRSTYNCNYSIWHWSNFGKCSVWSQLKMRVMDPSLLPSAVAEGSRGCFTLHYSDPLPRSGRGR
jgi:hypothetical protein